MIITWIEDDHRAGGALLQDVGNAAEPGTEERRNRLEAFARLWTAHGDMMAAAVHPRLGSVQAWPDPVAAALDLQQEVETLAVDLAEREAQGDGHWQPAFQRLLDVFARQCRVEETDLVSALKALPPEQVAEATRTAEQLRR